MPESPIRKLVPYAEKAKAKGVKVYHLNIGQPDIETPVDAINAVKKSDIKVLAYSKSEGDLVLREKISKYYKSHNVEITTSEIIVTSGASEALLFTIGSIMDPDDEVIIPEPFYANYNGFSIANGVKIIPIFSSIENNFSLPNIDKFETYKDYQQSLDIKQAQKEVQYPGQEIGGSAEKPGEVGGVKETPVLEGTTQEVFNQSKELLNSTDLKETKTIK